MTDQPTIANRYRLQRRIGAGSMGVVWEATDQLLNRPVAMKELLVAPEPTGGELDGRNAREARERMFREARLAARLQHAHTISVFDVVLHEDRPWLVMEYLPSRSLATVISEGGPLPPREVASIGEQIADGLAAAHAAGIVHRDVKPGNVLITDDGTVKLTDFGVSWAADDVALTRTGLIQGTPAFLAPEVARGQPPNSASDVFALGATLYTAVEGEPPFGLSDNTLAQLHIVAAGKLRPPSDAGPLTAALMRLLRADPDERPSASEARGSLAAVAAGGPPGGTETAALPRAGETSRSTVNIPTQGFAGIGPEQERTGHETGSPPRGAAAVLTGTAPLPAVVDGEPGVEPGEGPGEAAEPMPRVQPGRPRRSRIAILAVVLALLVLGGATTLVATAARNATPVGSVPAVSAPVAAPATVGTPSPTAAPSAGELVAFVEQYYALLPENLEAAFALLGPDAQRQSNGRDGFRNFYGQMAEVSVADGPRAVDDDVVAATIRFVDKAGVTNDDSYRFTVRRGGDGKLQIVTFRQA